MNLPASYYEDLNKSIFLKYQGCYFLKVFKNGRSSRYILLSSLVLLVSFLLYSAFAQSSVSSGAVELVAIDSSQLDYEGYVILDMDDDQYVTEEDLYLRLELINEQITNASTNLTYLQSTYGMRFTLTPITTNIAIKNSVNSVEYEGQLPQTRNELETLAEQINDIQNQIGDLDWTDPEIVSIKQYFDVMDENIYYALWYTGRG